MFGVHIEFYGVSLQDSSNEVISTIIVGIFDVEIINYKGEHNVSGLVLEYSGCISVNISKLFEMGNKYVLGNLSSFLQSM